jgi:hypothetical protein
LQFDASRAKHEVRWTREDVRRGTHRTAGETPALPFSDLDLVWVWFYKDVAPMALEMLPRIRRNKLEPLHMSVKITQPRNKQHDFWRRLYIRLLTEEMKPWDDLTPEERTLELGAIEDLVDAGYMAGKVSKDASGIPAMATIRGPTLAGRIFAEEQQDILDKKSFWDMSNLAQACSSAGWLASFQP